MAANSCRWYIALEFIHEPPCALCTVISLHSSPVIIAIVLLTVQLRKLRLKATCSR